MREPTASRVPAASRSDLWAGPDPDGDFSAIRDTGVAVSRRRRAWRRSGGAIGTPGHRRATVKAR
jgi:hypothetical protein